MATTFQNLFEAVLKRGHLSTNDTTALPLIKEWINSRYRQVARARPWRWLLKQGVIALDAQYTTGTVTTNGTTTVTGNGTVWTSAMVGLRFKTDDFEEAYSITAVPSATEITLNTPYQGENGSGKGYIIISAEYSLANDFDRLLDPHRSFAPYQLAPLGIVEMNRRWGFYATAGTPKYYTLFPDPSTGAMKFVLYPGAEEARTLYYDYFRAITPLTSNNDEPLIPENYRDILEIGAFADLLAYKDDSRATSWNAQFERRLAELAGDYALTDDMPRFRPADHYRSHYRTARRGRVDDPWGFNHGIYR